MTFAPRPGVRPVTEIDPVDWRWFEWLAADCTAIAEAADGKLLMFCGDTFTDEIPSSSGAVLFDHFTNNSLLWAWHGAFGVEYSSGVNIFGSPNPFVASYLGPAGFRWPTGAWLDSDGKVHCFYTGYDGSIFTSYTAARTDELILNDVAQESLTAVTALNPVTVGGNQVTWGHSPVAGDDGYLYIFGSWARPADGYRVVLARRLIDSGPAGTVTFWTGATWAATTATLGELGPTPGNSFSVVRHPAGGFLLTSYRKGLLTNTVVGWYASSFTGAWTDLGTLYTTPVVFGTQYNYGGLSYVVGSKLRILYNLNSSTAADLKVDYTRYGLRWAEVTVPAKP